MEASRTGGPLPSAEYGARHAFILALIVAVAAALRFDHLGYWGLEGAEIFTLRDSLVTHDLRGSRPLLFFLNYHLIRPWFGLGEMVVFIGILVVGLFYAWKKKALNWY